MTRHSVRHRPQIGAVVTSVDERGFLRLAQCGLLDAELLPGHSVVVHTAAGSHDAIRGAALNEELRITARGVAAAEGLPVQHRAVAGETLTDADALLPTSGAATGLIGIPIRYMHSAGEIVSGDDIENTAKLVAALARRLADQSSGESF